MFFPIANDVLEAKLLDSFQCRTRDSNQVSFDNLAAIRGPDQFDDPGGPNGIKMMNHVVGQDIQQMILAVGMERVLVVNRLDCRIGIAQRRDDRFFRILPVKLEQAIRFAGDQPVRVGIDFQPSTDRNRAVPLEVSRFGQPAIEESGANIGRGVQMDDETKSLRIGVNQKQLFVREDHFVG